MILTTLPKGDIPEGISDRCRTPVPTAAAQRFCFKECNVPLWIVAVVCRRTNGESQESCGHFLGLLTTSWKRSSEIFLKRTGGNFLKKVSPAFGHFDYSFVFHPFFPWQFLNFLPLPHGHGALRPTRSV